MCYKQCKVFTLSFSGVREICRCSEYMLHVKLSRIFSLPIFLWGAESYNQIFSFVSSCFFVLQISCKILCDFARIFLWRVLRCQCSIFKANGWRLKVLAASTLKLPLSSCKSFFCKNDSKDRKILRHKLFNLDLTNVSCSIFKRLLNNKMTFVGEKNQLKKLPVESCKRV